ncbi:M14 family metallopeptidase [Mariniflexile litorale]|uniref:M14 family metallopeptidase n=1 Tax=Mariniflexile litorale TaxID=3045158 RepID=A0AAU7EEX9_9FLAO|nr:M14 family metallopeptidase [Mariniflexile sp. KMM 9835]MDQ8211534.1 M14 family metallopeptidase [Mariniflexile sp. KMM 9835]
MQTEHIKSLFLKYKEPDLNHRYITNKHLAPLLENMSYKLHVETIGNSVLNNPIHGIKIGCGDKRILMWSQMHGNESTTTKALFDLLNTLLSGDSSVNHILNNCTLYIIPILSPDGAQAYTRINANQVDLNRDAQELTQPESNVLRDAFNAFKPHYCYNLHGQRTIFSVGKTNKPATVSFLAPAQDEACTITPNRKVAMEVIGVMNKVLQEVIPNQVGVYDDAFNINCVGDTFQSENTPTILFEAGHYHNDYGREETRRFIYMAYIASLDYISKNDVSGVNYESYLKIPENEKCFLDIIIKNAKIIRGENEIITDIGIQYQEKLIDKKVHFIPKVERIENLDTFYAHKIIQANKRTVFNLKGELLEVDNEIDFVMIDNEKISLLVK